MNDSNYWGNNQVKKRAAEAHNKKRREAHVEAVRLAQDKIDNPEKYKPHKRRVRQAQAFITTAMAISDKTNNFLGRGRWKNTTSSNVS